MTRARRICAGTAAVLALGAGAGGGTSTAAGLPPPRFAQSVDIGLISGTVVITPAHGTPFRLGVQDRSIPVGSRIDTRQGAVDLRTAFAPATTASATTANGVQDGHFSGGVFTILQRRGQHGLGVVDLAKPARVCTAGHAGTARVSAHVLALLHANVHGAFRTRGRYSAGTVRGTAWDTVERCDGTLTHVRRGTVSVSDFVRHRTVLVHAGQRYLAKP